MVNLMQKTVEYYKTHLWFQISLFFSMAILVITICYQEYMRKEYTEFLMEKSLMTESSVLETMQKNLDYSLDEYIEMGAQIALNQEMYSLAQDLFVTRADVPRSTRDLKTLCAAMASYSSNILNISLVSRDGDMNQYDRLMRADTMMWGDGDAGWLEEMYGQLYEKANSPGVPKYLVSALPAKHPVNQERVFHLFYPMLGKNNSFANMNAVVCITFRMDILQPLKDVVAKDDSSEGYITDDSGMIIYHSDESCIGEMEDTVLNRKSLITMERPLHGLGWNMHIALDKEKVDENVRDIIKSAMLVYIVLLVGLVFIFYLLMKKINNPLLKLQQAMQAAGGGGGRKQVGIEGRHEIWQVAEGYNEMIDKIRVQEAAAEENHQMSLLALERQHQAEQEALETQINAHFLCNTLGTINFEAMEEGNFKISLLIKKLSNILRYTFDRRCQEVYLSQEFAWIEQYLYLQKARLEDVFNYTIDFSEEFAHWPCCKLMLQPFVENAILHGFEGRESGGELRISAAGCDGCLRISITDNGCGILEDKKRLIQEMLNGENVKIHEDIGIGIQNVASRLRRFYGGQIKIQLKSQEGKGTEFVFLLPFPSGKEGKRHESDDSRR